MISVTWIGQFWTPSLHALSFHSFTLHGPNAVPTSSTTLWDPIIGPLCSFTCDVAYHFLFLLLSNDTFLLSSSVDNIITGSAYPFNSPRYSRTKSPTLKNFSVELSTCHWFGKSASSSAVTVSTNFYIHISQKISTKSPKTKAHFTECPLSRGLKNFTFRTFSDMLRFCVGFTDSNRVPALVLDTTLHMSLIFRNI